MSIAADKQRGRSAEVEEVAVPEIRKRIEEVFGWMKTIGGMRRPMRRGIDRVGWAFTSPPPPTIW